MNIKQIHKYPHGYKNKYKINIHPLNKIRKTSTYIESTPLTSLLLTSCPKKVYVPFNLTNENKMRFMEREAPPYTLPKYDVKLDR